MNEKKYRGLKIIVPIGIAITLITLFFTPLGLTAVFKVMSAGLNLGGNFSASATAFRVSICIYIAAVPYVIALFKLNSITKLMRSENPFDRKVSKLFRDLSILSYVEAAVFLAVALASSTIIGFNLYALAVISTEAVLVISITAGFVFKAMSDIFSKASDNKEEIDLTF